MECFRKRHGNELRSHYIRNIDHFRYIVDNSKYFRYYFDNANAQYVYNTHLLFINREY